MNVVIRADASVATGSGHVMRCLTLAGALRERGAAVSFVSRAHSGHLGDSISEQGFKVTLLPLADPTDPRAPWEEDGERTLDVLGQSGSGTDWLVVDHYDFDERWERIVRGSGARMMVIDDLADRPHDCDVLLDQNFDNPRHRRYAERVPAGTRQLLGTRYALVRPEFSRQREAALRRRDGRFARVLVTMGGSDPANDTATVLAGLALRKGSELAVDVVVGNGNPHRQQIRDLCAAMGAQFHVQTNRMAELMAQADLAINGGGSTTWERCVVGLPALVAIQSEDQEAIATALGQLGAHRVLGWTRVLSGGDYAQALEALTAPERLRMSTISATLCDGGGAARVADELMNWKG
ncbi:MAG: UDP-2,4-diacetamido-2,4,6-trideoxy-beta-L-altropyranose hydrolase [Gammaproteobacteria bacterium]